MEKSLSDPVLLTKPDCEMTLSQTTSSLSVCGGHLLTAAAEIVRLSD